MNKTLLSLAILAGFLFSASDAKAQISTMSPEGSNTQWILIDGSDEDDSVWVYETFGGTRINLYDHDGNLVDSMFIFDPNLYRPPSLFGPTKKTLTVIIADLKDGDDFYFNNSTRIDGDRVFCGTGKDIVYAGPGESTVFSDYLDTSRKEIFGGDGDDWLVGGAGNDRIEGGNGDDLIQGNDGNDALYGDAGDDEIDGGSGFNWMFGGIGNDTYRADEPLNVIVEVEE